MRVLPLVGPKSLRPFYAFHKLMLGLKFLPAYMGESYEDFYERISEMDEASQEKIIREAACFVELQRDEIEGFACFCADPNGVPYTEANIKNLGPKDLIDMIVAVSMAIARLKIDLVTPAEKKNSQASQ